MGAGVRSGNPPALSGVALLVAPAAANAASYHAAFAWRPFVQPSR